MTPEIAETANESALFLGKLIIQGDLRIETGLAISSGESNLAIGAVDKPIIRNPVTGKPYIPGSSLKGKMRTLLERATEKLIMRPVIKRGQQTIKKHYCESWDDYSKCDICPLFGITPDRITKADDYNGEPLLTRLQVVDIMKFDESPFADFDTDMPFSEIKNENVIDTFTAQATPRQMERIPGGVTFQEFRLLLAFYTGDYEANNSNKLVGNLLTAMRLLEDDYLGASGSRGYGKVKFENLKVTLRTRAHYISGDGPTTILSAATLSGVKTETIMSEVYKLLKNK